MKQYVAEMKQGEVVLSLPDDIAIVLSKIILHWSHQVWLLQQITYALLDVDQARGRIAVRDPRPEEYVPMIQELMELSGVTTKANLDDLREDLRKLKGLRDGLAHGVWIKSGETGRILVQTTAGKWQPKGGYKAVSKRVAPVAEGITSQGLETIRLGIHQTLVVTQKLLAEVEEQLSASPKRFSRQSVVVGLRHGPK